MDTTRPTLADARFAERRRTTAAEYARPSMATRVADLAAMHAQHGTPRPLTTALRTLFPIGR